MSDIIERFYNRRRFGIQPGLARINKMLSLLGDPQNSFKSVHIAGTNGKGSVCAMLEAMLSASGLKVGLYTSPHLVKFNERMRINGIDISDEELEKIAVEIEQCAELVEKEIGEAPTFFEVATALAFLWFKRQQVEIAVVETGMGGRLDATNVIMPETSIITSIGIEHTAYLGDTLEKIAFEKGGIIKNGIPVVCGKMPSEAFSVLKQIAISQKTMIHSYEEISLSSVKTNNFGITAKIESPSFSYGTLSCPLAGRYQLINLATAIAAMERLHDRHVVSIDPVKIKKGLENTRWHGRMEVICKNPILILDGAHNPEAAIALVESLKNMKKRKALICGMCSDKDAFGFASAFKGTVERVWIVPIASERNIAHEVLSSAFHQIGCLVSCQKELVNAFGEAYKWATDNDGIVVAVGSLFLVGEILDKMNSGILKWEGKKLG